MRAISREKDYSEYIRFAYNSALEDIRFFKMQQIRVTNYSLALYAAIITIFYKFGIVCREWWIFVIAVISFFSAYILIQLQNSLGNVRSRKDAARDKLPSGLRKLFFNDIKSKNLDHNLFFFLMLGIIIGGGVISFWILWTMPTQIYQYCPFL